MMASLWNGSQPEANTTASLVLAGLWNGSTDVANESGEVLVEATRHLSVTGQVVISAFYTLAVVGNLAALGFLYRSDSKPRNRKHALMLRCLAANDLVAVVGMMVQMNLQLYQPALVHSIWFCRVRVLWRFFGLGSGCVVIVMAVERWFALTRPFFYQKYVTMDVIRQSIFLLWSADLFLVCLPFFGFGIYYQHRTATCVRYKMATLPRDIGYAYLYITFGALLCLCLVWCNLAVMRALCHMGRYSQKRRPVLSRRISGNHSLTLESTREELAFARLMAFLCIVFVLCWVPQLISVPLAQIDPDSPSSRAFFRTADILLALHFMLDPVLYVLQRWPFFRSHCCANGRNSRNSSMKTTTHELVSL